MASELRKHKELDTLLDVLGKRVGTQTAAPALLGCGALFSGLVMFFFYLVATMICDKGSVEVPGRRKPSKTKKRAD